MTTRTRTAGNATRLLLSLLAVLMTAALLPALATAAPGECANEGVRSESDVNPATGSPYDLGLPECRAYEMVSPLEKQAHNALLYRNFFPTLDGAVGWSSQGDVLEPEDFEVSFNQNNAYISRRTAGGWESRSEWAPAGLIAGQGNADFTPDLTSAEVRCGNTGQSFTLSANDGLACALRGASGAWLATPAYPSLNGVHPHLNYEGASRDLSTVVFELNPFTFLVPEDTYSFGTGGSTYEIIGLGGSAPQLKLVNVTTGGETIGSGHRVSLGYLEEGKNEWDAYQAVSNDGGTIYFTAVPASGIPTLYARIDGSETIAISNPDIAECTTCDPTVREGKFQGASADGSKVFFTTEQQLLNSDSDTTTDLYEYDFNRPSAARIVQLSGGGAGDLTPGVGAGVQGVVRTSPDGSRVYFVATGVLTTIPNGNGQVAQTGEDNMYVVDTSSGGVKFIADLCSAAEQSGTQADLSCPANPKALDSSLWSLDKGQSQSTPDGRYLVFATVARLTADDTNSAADIYRYDSQTGGLLRVSTGEPGYPASGDNNTGANAEINEPPTREVSGGAFADVNDAGRSITDDGSEIVFVTSASLQADDVNAAGEPATCEPIEVSPGCDAYLWHEGTVSMISSGVESSAGGGESTGVYDAVISPSGSDIYFATRAQLVGQDVDHLADVYDARRGGGFPAPKPEPSCTGAEWSCQATGPQAPAGLKPEGTAIQQPGGNLAPPAFKEVIAPEGGQQAARTQKLAAALKVCRKVKRRSRRAMCEKQARKRYAPVKGKTRAK
jgi:hypothetical protein